MGLKGFRGLGFCGGGGEGGCLNGPYSGALIRTIGTHCLCMNSLQFGTVARLNSSVTEKRRRYQLDLIQPCNTATDLDITDFLWPLCPHELVRVDRTC